MLKSRSVRLSEVWFHRGLWLVAVIFAFFLLGLGRAVIHDLPRVEASLSIEQFVDRQQVAQLDNQIKVLQDRYQQQQAEVQRMSEARDQLVARLNSEQQNFNDWLKTRLVTERSETNPEVMQRIRLLEKMRTEVNQRDQQIQARINQENTTNESQRQVELQKQRLYDQAQPKLESAQWRQEMQVFGYRLALTLPLLLLAAWLWRRYRHTSWWPFVWGFIFFALITFFIELVPYLPSYGGYVRYGIGIIVTLVIGRQVIKSLNRYLEQQRLNETLSEQVRREELDHDTVFKRLAAGACPSCERPLNLGDPTLDFCPHCGLCLHDHCVKCDHRKSAFLRFCQVCGTPAKPASPIDPEQPLTPVSHTTS